LRLADFGLLSIFTYALNPGLNTDLTASSIKAAAIAKDPLVDYLTVRDTGAVLPLGLVDAQASPTDGVGPRLGANLVAYGLESPAFTELTLLDDITIRLTSARPVVVAFQLTALCTDDHDSRLKARLVTIVIKITTFTKLTLVDDLSVRVALAIPRVCPLCLLSADTDDLIARLASGLVAGAIESTAVSELTCIDDLSLSHPLTALLLAYLGLLTVLTDALKAGLDAGLTAATIKATALSKNPFVDDLSVREPLAISPLGLVDARASPTDDIDP
jgi:hypothetical protein